MKEDLKLQDYISKINKAKENIASNFYEIGECLNLIKENKLYKEKGLNKFNQFINDPVMDIGERQASSLLKLTSSDEYRPLMPLGINKLSQIMKLEPEKKKLFFAKYDVKTLSLKKLRDVITDLNRSDKIRCDRCNRLVEKAKELDGKFYGCSGKHSCYDLEMEDRRALLQSQIPPSVLDNVLDTLKKSVPQKSEAGQNTVNWLPKTVYVIYNQLLKEEDTDLSVSEDEAESLLKLMRLLKNRLDHIQDSSKKEKKNDSN